MTPLILTAQRLKHAPIASKTSAQVGLAQNSSGSYALDVDLHVKAQDLLEADARALVDAAHPVCPYTGALRGKVQVRLHVTIV